MVFIEAWEILSAVKRKGDWPILILRIFDFELGHGIITIRSISTTLARPTGETVFKPQMNYILSLIAERSSLFNLFSVEV